MQDDVAEPDIRVVAGPEHAPERAVLDQVALELLGDEPPIVGVEVVRLSAEDAELIDEARGSRLATPLADQEAGRGSVDAARGGIVLELFKARVIEIRDIEVAARERQRTQGCTDREG